MKNDIFFSYDKRDKSVAYKVCDYLEQLNVGYKCWIAPRDIPPGQDYARAIVRAIKNTKIVILILSEHSNTSTWVSKEIERAVDLNISIIPFKIEELELSENMELYISSMQWLDAVPPPIENHYSKLINALSMSPLEIRIITDETSKKLKFFRGVHLPEQEIEALRELEYETNCNIEFIERYENILNQEFNEFGVYLENNSVKSLGIKSCDLTDFPESIKKLNNVRGIVLNDVKINEFPQFLYNLGLDFLSLANTNLFTLPDDIYKLGRVGILDLSHNHLSDLPESLCDLEGDSLYLHNNNIATLPRSFKNVDFGIIDLRKNPLEREFNDLTKNILKKLKAKGKKIDINLSLSLDEKIEKKEKLSRDFFKGISLPTTEIEFLQDLMSVLNLSEDSIEIIQKDDIIVNFNFNEIGIRLNIENRISELGISSLKLKDVPKSILNLEKMYVLVLYDVGLKEFPEIICEMKFLDFLNLSGNDIEYLPESIKNLDGIQVLNLGDNKIKKLPKSLGTMMFYHLELDGNPVISNPDLRSRYIISYLETEVKSNDFTIPEISFKHIERDKELGINLEDMIYDYQQLNICKPSETYINTIKQDQIIDELIDIGYTAVDFLINEWLMGYEDIRPIAEEILDSILEHIAPNWREEYENWT